MVADRAAQHRVSRLIHLGRFGVDDDHARARVSRGRHHARDGPHESLVPTASMRSHRRAAWPARARSAWTSDCPKEIVADFRMPPQVRQAGVVLARPHALEHAFHGRPLAAREAADLPHRAVDLDDALGGRTRQLMEPVHVLRDQGVELAPPLEHDESAMTGIGLGPPGRRFEPTPPGAPAHVGIGEVVLQRGELSASGFRVHTPWGPRKSESPSRSRCRRPSAPRAAWLPPASSEPCRSCRTVL